jgi:hypothetical protein
LPLKEENPLWVKEKEEQVKKKFRLIKYSFNISVDQIMQTKLYFFLHTTIQTLISEVNQKLRSLFTLTKATILENIQNYNHAITT